MVAANGQTRGSLILSIARLSRTFALAATLASLCCLAILFAGADRAGADQSPFKIEFDSSEIQFAAIADLPLDALSTKASLEGTIDEHGSVNVPKGKFKMPEVGIEEPIALKGFLGIESDATGTFDESTGRLELDAKAGLWVSVDVEQVLGIVDGLGIDLGNLGGFASFLPKDLTCGFSPMDVHFTTEGTSLAGGRRFLSGPSGPGSISAEWSKLGPFAGRTKVFGLIDACTLLKDQIPGLLGGVAGVDLGGLDLSDLDNLDLGPSGITLVRTRNEPVVKPPDPPAPDPDPAATSSKLKLKISPRLRKAKAGKTVKYRARITNSGPGTAERVSVCVKAPKRAARSKKACRQFGSISPATGKTRTFKLRIRRGAAGKRFKLRFRAKTGAGKTPKTTAALRVR